MGHTRLRVHPGREEVGEEVGQTAHGGYPTRPLPTPRDITTPSTRLVFPSSNTPAPTESYGLRDATRDRSLLDTPATSPRTRGGLKRQRCHGGGAPTYRLSGVTHRNCFHTGPVPETPRLLDEGSCEEGLSGQVPRPSRDRWGVRPSGLAGSEPTDTP